jgi:hypothetical protein
MTQSGHAKRFGEYPLLEGKGDIGYVPALAPIQGIASPPGCERTLSRPREPRSQRCGPERFSSRSARKILLWRLAIHRRPFDVTLR